MHWVAGSDDDFWVRLIVDYASGVVCGVLCTIILHGGCSRSAYEPANNALGVMSKVHS